MFKPRFQFTPQIATALMQIESARQAISDMPIHALLLRQLRETATLSSNHFSTQIEGNRLTLPEVREVLQGGKFPGRERDETEVRNHYRAFEYMERIAGENSPLTEVEIKSLHALVLFGRAKASPYREQQNVIRDSASGRIVYLPPESGDVPELMQALVLWVNTELEVGQLPAPIIAGIAHYQFATIHPYLDGNGRTARLLTTLILRRSGYGLSGIYSLDEHYARNLGAYYEALTIGHHNYYEGREKADITSFVSYFTLGMAEAFAQIKLAASRGSQKREDQSSLLRELDPKQRRLLELFTSQGSATAQEMAAHLKMSPRTIVALCREWIASGFLEYQNASRKIRSYRLGEKFHGRL